MKNVIHRAYKTQKTQKETKVVKSFRFSFETVKQLNRIAKHKKTTQTKIMEQLIYIAYVGLFEKFGVELEKFFKALERDMSERENKMKKATQH